MKEETKIKAERIFDYLVKTHRIEEYEIRDLCRPYPFKGSWYRNAWNRFLAEAIDHVEHEMMLEKLRKKTKITMVESNE